MLFVLPSSLGTQLNENSKADCVLLPAFYGVFFERVLKPSFVQFGFYCLKLQFLYFVANVDIKLTWTRYFEMVQVNQLM